MSKKLTKEDYICPDCGHIGPGGIFLRGSGTVERLLWYALLIPGPFYSLWRRTSRQIECANCRGKHLVSLDSKLGATMLENKLRGR
jgi:DNA-directed RNA polymerase subunit RPC12/RpoP